MDANSETKLAEAWRARELDPNQSLSLLTELGSYTERTELLGAKISVVNCFHCSRVFEFRKTLDTGAEALAVLQGRDEPLWLSRLYGRLAVGFHYMGDIASAYRYFLLQIEMAARCESGLQREELFYAYHNLARHFFKIGHNELAHEHYEKAYDFTGPDEYLFGFLQVNHAQCLIKRKEYPAATAQVNLALEIGCRLNIARICHYALPVLGTLAALSDNPREAERLFLEAVTFANDNNLPLYEVYLQLAELYLASSDYERAKAIVDLADATSSGMGDKIHAVNVHELRCEIHESLHEYEAALEQHKAFHELKLALFSTEQKNKNYAQDVARRIGLVGQNISDISDEQGDNELPDPERRSLYSA